MKHLLFAKLLMVCSVLQLITSVSIAQPPSAKDIFERINKAVSNINTLSYDTRFVNFNSGHDDSLQIYNGTVWLKTVKEDTIYGTHFHISVKDGSGIADYYYDGINAYDIWHQSKHKELDKSITIIEPRKLGNGYNTVQSRMSVLPYLNELINMQAISLWFKKDSIQVNESADKKHWILEWPENSIPYNFYSKRKIWVDKKSNLIVQMIRNGTWNGTRIRNEHYINNIRINNPDDTEAVMLNRSYPDYKTTYEKNNTTKENQLTLLTGHKTIPFSYASFNGETVDLKAEKGKLLLLDFWETWCGYCYLAMPKLKALYNSYNNKGLEIVGIVTENKKGVEEVLKKEKFAYKTIYADEKLLAYYKVEGRPTYVLINDTGTIVEHSIGSFDKIEQAVKQRLGK